MLAVHAPEFSRNVLAGPDLKKITSFRVKGSGPHRQRSNIIERQELVPEPMTGKIKGCHKVSMTVKTIGFSGSPSSGIPS